MCLPIHRFERLTCDLCKRESAYCAKVIVAKSNGVPVAACAQCRGGIKWRLVAGWQDEISEENDTLTPEEFAEWCKENPPIVAQQPKRGRPWHEDRDTL